jgi:hypothetical protein
MLLRRWCLGLLFCASVSVACGQERPPTVVEASPARAARIDEPSGAQTASTTFDAVVIEVTIAQWRTKPGKAGEAQIAPSLKEVDLAALEKSGELRIKEQIHLTTLDQQKAFFQRGESVPVITGMNAPSRGGTFFRRSVNYRQVGTMVTVTPRIAKGRIIVEAKIERSSIREEDTAVIAKADDGEETHASAMVTGTAQTTVAVESGKTVIVGGITRQGKDSGDGELILISAEIASRGLVPASDRSGEGGSLHRRYAEGLVNQFDENKNGVLDRDEWKKMRGDPAKADGNDDKIITVDELAERLLNYANDAN